MVSVAMITFESVTKRYGKRAEHVVTALDDVSFSVDPGEVFGYIGPNGAGKTTTIKIIVGLIRDFEGNVTIGDSDTGTSRKKAGAGHLVGYLPQSSGFQPWRTVEMTLRTFGRLSWLDDATLSRRIDEVLELVSISEHRNRRITHLSGGTLQRLRLAQAVLHDPPVLVLDEPMTGLDPASRHRFKELIRELSDDRRVVFFSSHILADVEDLATRIGIVSSGRMMRSGTPAELRRIFGLGQIVEVELADHARSIEAESVVAEGIESVSSASNRTLRFVCPSGVDLDASIRSVLRWCLEQSVPVRRVEHLAPSLEEVYLNLTGTDATGANR